MMRSRHATSLLVGGVAAVASITAVGVAVAGTPSPAPHKAIQDRVGPDLATPPPGYTAAKPADPRAEAGTTGPVAQVGEGHIQSPAALDGVPMPFSAGTINLSNVYLGHAGNDYVDLYAGSNGSDSTLGMLIVRVDSATGAQPRYPSGNFTLSSTGPLSLTKVVDNIVTLTDSHGQTHVFSLATDQFN